LIWSWRIPITTDEDGEYWDETDYTLPSGAVRIDVAFYYQTTSKEYIEFLRDENTVDTMGDDLYAAWVNHGRSAPVAMAQQSLVLDVSGLPEENQVPRVTTLGQNYPNPFNPQTRIDFSLSEERLVSLRVYDERGRLVRSLVDQTVLPKGEQQIVWLGRDDAGRGVASGVYHYILDTGASVLKRKMTLVR
jgi:FlgD Ig-like domain